MMAGNLNFAGEPAVVNFDPYGSWLMRVRPARGPWPQRSSCPRPNTRNYWTPRPADGRDRRAIRHDDSRPHSASDDPNRSTHAWHSNRRPHRRHVQILSIAFKTDRSHQFIMAPTSPV